MSQSSGERQALPLWSQTTKQRKCIAKRRQQGDFYLKKIQVRQRYLAVQRQLIRKRDINKSLHAGVGINECLSFSSQTPLVAQIRGHMTGNPLPSPLHTVHFFILVVHL